MVHKNCNPKTHKWSFLLKSLHYFSQIISLCSDFSETGNMSMYYQHSYIRLWLLKCLYNWNVTTRLDMVSRKRKFYYAFIYTWYVFATGTLWVLCYRDKCRVPFLVSLPWIHAARSWIHLQWAQNNFPSGWVKVETVHWMTPPTTQTKHTSIRKEVHLF